MTDRESISFGEVHELNYLLEKFNKRSTQANREILIEIGKEYKKEKKVRIVNDREDFYKYLQANKKFKTLEDKK